MGLAFKYAHLLVFGSSKIVRAAGDRERGVGAFKRVLPLICDATFGVQRGAGFTVSMLQMLPGDVVAALFAATWSATVP